MMMAIAVSDVVLPLPRPNFPASLRAAPSPLSRASGATLPPAPAPLLPKDETRAPLLTLDEFHAMMAAEYGYDLSKPLFTEEEFRALMLEFEAQAPPRPIMPDAPRPNNQARGKKRKAAPPPPSSGEEPAKAEIQGPRTRSSKRTKRDLMIKKFLKRILSRDFSAESPSRGETVLWCQCKELPRDSPGCVLHQDAPERSWMTAQGRIPKVGGVGTVLVPRLYRRGNVCSQYRWWRRGVWMPSRFYLEHAQEVIAQQEDLCMLAD